MQVDENKIKSVTRQYLKEYLDKDWMMPLKKFMSMDETDEAIECAFSNPYRFKEWVESNDDVMFAIQDMVENEQIRPDIFDLEDVEFVEEASDLFKGGLKDYCEDFIQYTSASGDRDIPLFVASYYVRDVHNEWLVHMTNNLTGITQEGFNIGVTIDELAYTPAIGTTDFKYGPGYNFAFSANEADEAERSNYGKYCVLFQGSGIMIWHYGDEQNQVIFYGPSAKNLIFITKHTFGEYEGMWCIDSWYDDSKTLCHFDDLPTTVDWAIRNFAQYRNHLVGKAQPQWFERRRNLPPEKKWWADKKVSEGIFSKYCELN